MGKKGQVPWNKGKTGIYSEETKRKISRKGSKQSEETKRKLSAVLKGYKHSPETRKNMRKAAQKRFANTKHKKISFKKKLFKKIKIEI